MATIIVTPQSGDEFAVEVTDPGGTSRHTVTATAAHLAALDVDDDPERVVEESFRFLLEREPKEAILTRFELPVIARYFPEYPAEIRSRLGS